MNVISITIEYKGIPIKIEDGKIFLRSFGTTILDHSMHWSWMEIKIDDLKPDLKKLLKSQNLI